jgi:hypothetical protein
MASARKRGGGEALTAASIFEGNPALAAIRPQRFDRSDSTATSG